MNKKIYTLIMDKNKKPLKNPDNIDKPKRKYTKQIIKPHKQIVLKKATPTFTVKFTLF